MNLHIYIYIYPNVPTVEPQEALRHRIETNRPPGVHVLVLICLGLVVCIALGGSVVKQDAW